jgi:hypothetical protein
MDINHFEPGDVIIHANQQAPSMCAMFWTKIEQTKSLIAPNEQQP